MGRSYAHFVRNRNVHLGRTTQNAASQLQLNNTETPLVRNIKFWVAMSGAEAPDVAMCLHNLVFCLMFFEEKFIYLPELLKV